MEANESLALRWTTAFPWIPLAARATGRANGASEPWWLDTVSASPPRARRESVAAIADMALACMTKWSLGELFPLLPQGIPLDALPFTNRARNVFKGNGLVVTDDLQGNLLEDLLDLRQVGFGTADSILRVLAQTCVEEANVQGYAEPDLLDSSSPLAKPLSLALHDLIDDLSTVAAWYSTIGFTDSPLLGAPAPAGCPDQVLKAQERLLRLSARDVLHNGHADLGIAALLEAELGQLAHRDRALIILANRFFADRPQTLDEIARRLGITRERVRQLESRSRAQLVGSLDRDTPLAIAGQVARDLIGTVLPLTDLLRLVPSLGDVVESVGQPACRVLDRLDDAYEIEDGWCAAPSVDAAKTATQTLLLERASKHGVVARSDFTLLSNHPQVSAPAEATEAWLTYCGYEVDEDWVLMRTSSVRDRAAAVLSIVGSPMSAQEILDRMRVDRTLASLRNAIASDDRFKRVDRDKWGLAEWEMESYDGIKAQIRQELSRNDGELPLNTLIERITRRYSVAPNSVIVFASNPPFTSRGGVVRFAAVSDRGTRKPLSRTRHVYRQGESVLYRVTITSDHLRGSGFPVPVALAAAAGLQPGDCCEFTSPLGPQAFYWTGPQPAIGSIRSLLIDRDIAAGQDLFLKLGTDRTFDVRPISDATPDPLITALRLVGYDDDDVPANPLPALARAIDIPVDSPAVSVIGAYRDRGDIDVADLLLDSRPRLERSAEPQPTLGAEAPSAEIPDIDEILDLL